MQSRQNDPITGFQEGMEDKEVGSFVTLLGNDSDVTAKDNSDGMSLMFAACPTWLGGWIN